MTKEALSVEDTLKLALEAYIKAGAGNSTDFVLQRAAYDLAVEALAQPEQEPMATDWERIARVQNAKLMAMCNEAGGFEKLCEVMDKYEKTTPPQRTWVGLTDGDIDECYSRDPRVAARNAEAKLKEKNT